MPAASSLSVLTVDDQRSIRALVMNGLQDLGVKRMIEAENGQHALHILKHNPVHLVISDLNMPIMDGLQLLAAVRKDPALKSTAFIMLTSRGEVDLVKQAVQLGVNNYLTKPFALGMLRKKIEAVLGPLT